MSEKYRKKEGRNVIDIDVEDIDREEVMQSSQRAEKIAEYILAHHNRKTHSKEFTAIFCTSSIDMLIKYYELLQSKKQKIDEDLTIAAIYSYAANEEDKDANGLLDDDTLAVLETKNINVHSREKLDAIISDYNQTFKTNYSTQSGQLYYDYYKDIAKRVKTKEIDILLVVNMFLTGFDSKRLNTLYVDKNLRYHGLIQAFSRTNRILNNRKSQGNIVAFRNLKKRTDQAIALYADKNAKEDILLEPYETYVKHFKQAIDRLYSVKPSLEYELQDEDEKLKFVQAFRELIRIHNILVNFTDFDFKDLSMDEQTYENFKSQYLDIHEEVRNNKQKEVVSILEDIDFEVELTRRDEINVAYIIRLIAGLHKIRSGQKAEKQKQKILDLINGDVQLRSKAELIQKFIEKNLPDIKDSSANNVFREFVDYWDREKQVALNKFCEERNVDRSKLDDVISEILFSNREPLNNTIVQMLNKKPMILDRKRTVHRVRGEMMDLIETFVEDAPNMEELEVAEAVYV